MKNGFENARSLVEDPKYLKSCFTIVKNKGEQKQDTYTFFEM